VSSASSAGSLGRQSEDGGGGGGGGGDPAVSDAELAGTGRALEPAIRAKMEKRFGTSLAHVQIHTEPQAAAIVASKGVRAFTYKNHIAFVAGAYDPGSPAGEALLVHELTHVVQAAGATSDRLQVPAASAAGGAHEAEADRNAGQAHRNASAGPAADGATAGTTASHLAGPAAGELALPSVAAGDAAAARFGQREDQYEAKERVDPERRHQCGGGCDGGTPTPSPTPSSMTLSPVTINVVQAATALSQRGAATYRVRWSVGGGKNGWVIQHATQRAAIKNASENAVASTNITTEFWEGWQVRNGDVFVGSSTTRHSADSFTSRDENPDTKGRVELIGKVAFVEGYNLTEPPWGHTVPSAGALPTMTSAPAGWSDGGAQDHKLTIDYDDIAKTPQTQVGLP
jgi:hypothetical protein